MTKKSPVVPPTKHFYRIPTHVASIPPEASIPIRHYEKCINDAWNLLLYVERNLKKTNCYQAVSDRHIHRLSSMVLLSMIEALERFLKELAAICVDNVANFVLDDRLDIFTVKGQTRK